ncbi:MAG: RHS repeat-associated core domain-containing protein, partial [Phycisphaerae bacterium]
VTDNSGPANPTVAWQGKQGYQFEQPLGLQYVRQRWYDPVTRQFISQDPLGFAGGDVNLFRYAGNNPVNQNDPGGTDGGALAKYLFYRHAAILLARDLRMREQASPIQHPGYIGLLYGIWRAAYWKAESSYNKLYNRFGGGPWEVLSKVKEELEKVEKAVHVKRAVPLAKKITEDIEKELKTVNTLISTLQAGHGLSSGNEIAQLKGLGNALNAMGNLVPEELGFGSVLKAYGSYLAGAAGAIDRTYASYGSHSAYRFWVEQLNESSPTQQPGLAFSSNLSPTTPFTPAWALRLEREHNYGLGPYAASFNRKYGWIKEHQEGGGD